VSQIRRPELAGRVHRVAISNHRIVDVSNGKVSFEYKDRKKGDLKRVMTLEATEFVRRFLLHVLPEGFMRIRHYGFLANRSKKRNLERLTSILDFEYSAEPENKNAIELILELTGVDVTRCPCCGKGTMRVVSQIYPLPHGLTKNNQPQPRILDSS